MQNFLVLIGEIFFISCLQMIIEMFIDPDKRPQQARLVNIACFVGSMSLLLHFIATTLYKELNTIISISF